MSMLAVAGLAGVYPATSGAQSVRVSGVTTFQSVDFRPLVDDSVSVSEVTGTGPYRALPDGRLVRCTGEELYCHFRSAGARVASSPVIQDLRASAWGLGQGISLHAHVRLRDALGSALPWPRSEDSFDALETYLQLDRGGARARAGRQWVVSGLGVYNYDGASLRIRRGRSSVEGFAGRSLVAGLNSPVSSGDLGVIDDLPPDDGGRLYGLTWSAAMPGNGSASATWQRVIRNDRAALYSDRAAANASARVLGVNLDGALAWDLSKNEANEARLRVSRRLPGRLSASIEARRHRPFFEAWTIWGAFSPVAFDEARAGVAWMSRDGRLTMDARGGRRNYDETGEGLDAAPLRGDGWRAGAGAQWARNDHWLWYADYDIDIGFGASRNDAAGGARWMPDENRYLGVALSSLQNIYEFRVGTGRVNGVRVEGSARLLREARLVVDAAFYSHGSVGVAAAPDWSQRRVLVRLDWTVGRDPGAAPRQAGGQR